MRTVWVLSQFAADPVTGQTVPVAADYANAYLAPANPLAIITNPSHVQHVAGTYGTAVKSITPTVGNSLVAAVAWSYTAGSVPAAPTVTDNQGNMWTTLDTSGPTSGATPALVQSFNVSHGGVLHSTTVAFTSSTTIGNLLILYVANQGANLSPTITDAGGNTFTLLNGFAETSATVVAAVVYYCFSTAVAGTITINNTSAGGNLNEIVLMEFSGAAALNVQAGGSPNASLVTTTDSDLVLAFGLSGNGAPSGDPSGFTDVANSTSLGTLAGGTGTFSVSYNTNIGTAGTYSLHAGTMLKILTAGFTPQTNLAQVTLYTTSNVVGAATAVTATPDTGTTSTTIGLVEFIAGTLDGHSNTGAGTVVTSADHELIIAAAFGTTAGGTFAPVTVVGLANSLTLLPSGALSPDITFAYDTITSPTTTNIQMTGATNVWEVYASFFKSISSGQWGLVQIQSDPPQIAALLLDARVVFVGTNWDTPPSIVTSVYSAFLLGGETLMGQVLNELGNNLDARFSPL